MYKNYSSHAASMHPTYERFLVEQKQQRRIVMIESCRKNAMNSLQRRCNHNKDCSSTRSVASVDMNSVRKQLPICIKYLHRLLYYVETPHMNRPYFIDKNVTW